MSSPLFLYEKKMNMNFSIELELRVYQRIKKRFQKIIVDTLMTELLNDIDLIMII